MLTTIDRVTLAARDPKSAAERYRALLGREPNREDAARTRFQLDNVALDIVASIAARELSEPATAGADIVEGIAAIAFATLDIAKARHTLERRGIAIQELAGQVLELATTATHGVTIQVVERRTSAAPTPLTCDASAAIAGLDHVVIATSHPERAAALYGARLGLEMKLDRTNPDWDARLMFFKCGDAIVEVAHSLKNADPNTPDTAWGLSWRTDDIDATNARLGRSGFDVSNVRTGRKPGTRVFTVRDAPAGVPTLVIGR